MVLPVAIAVGIGLSCGQYVRSVADFMAGGRAAGRYLLSSAKSIQLAGAVMFVALFQVFNSSGFVTNWWQQISVPVSLVITITGFVFYRYRQTRALTIAQFFEMRYSRNIRLFTGALGFLAGILNFGIVPIIGARFFVYFAGLPDHLSVLGTTIPTYLPLMACFLIASSSMIIVGGQVTVLVTNSLDAIFSRIGYAIIAVALVILYSWSEIAAAIGTRSPGKSMVNPFDSFQTADFNIWWVLMTVAFYAYGTMAWQNNHAFNSSAATPHDSRMSGILSAWIQFSLTLATTLLAACAYTYMTRAANPEGVAAVQRELAQIPDKAIANQMWTPIALAHLLPVGIKGLVGAILLMGIICGDAIHLHSWSSIFLQDVVIPLRKKPLSVKMHLLWLRLGVVGVALFAFIFGTLFKQTEYIVMWFSVTTAIYVGGAGAVIVGGLYWSRGTTAGAWAGLIIGSVLSTGGILMRQIHPDFPLNGTEISFYAALIAIAAYVAVSLLTCRQPHDMDRLLHRGAYAVEAESPNLGIPDRNVSWVARVVGIDEDFTAKDRLVAYSIFYYSVMSFAVVVLGTGLYLWRPWPDQIWSDYWYITSILIPLVITIGTAIWFTIGCVSDLKLFFQRLKAERVDVTDDGRVSENEIH